MPTKTTASVATKRVAKPAPAKTVSAPNPSMPLPPVKAAKAAPATKTAKPMQAQSRAKVVNTDKAGKAPKLHRKPVRDSFTLPEADYALFATLKARSLAQHRATKKSELVRAGLQALNAMDSLSLVEALEQLAPAKPGRAC